MAAEWGGQGGQDVPAVQSYAAGYAAGANEYLTTPFVNSDGKATSTIAKQAWTARGAYYMGSKQDNVPWKPN